MTGAPENLLAVRRLLLTHLNVDPGTTRAADLEPAEVGIVGDPAHRGGYHCGSDRVDSDDYSVDESPRDRAGLTLDASALDVGGFEVRVAGKLHNLASFSIWCVAQCKAGAADTRDIREVIYSPDGVTVRRWDRLGLRSSGDISHVGHTHFSFFRDAIKAGRDQQPLFRRYLTYIGLIEATDSTEDDMTPNERWVLHVINYRLEGIKSNRAIIRVPARPDLGAQFVAFEEPNLLAVAVGADDTDEEALAAQLAKLLPAGTAVTDEQLARALRQVFAALGADQQG